MKLEKKYTSLASIIKKHNVANTLAVEACFSLLSSGNRIDKECAKQLGNYQLSEGRFMVLVLLFEYKVLSPQEIAALSGVTKPTITSFIHSLVKDELVNKTDAPSDGRKIDLTLTEKGKNLISKIFKEHSLWIVGITKNLTDSEMETFICILNKISHHKHD
ncbi:MarR family winged helix-turn-helix transcriptional regulator [Snodgrassella gandavensis]|uniref:MarR family winged helix-turn-helix transcriptional regulator n=1 Tax=Snodgrassella gandavensis TaxID=2946698 RepID=UPI001EF40611|nr:MarR family transcriptional regulator [Snodgrassella gandavensis]